MFRFVQHDSAIYEMTFREYEQSLMVRCDWMDRSRPALGGLRNDFLQKTGSGLDCLSTPQHHWQRFLGREHDLLSGLSFVFCERDLGWNSYFFNRD
jgi:hypothetical protein